MTPEERQEKKELEREAERLVATLPWWPSKDNGRGNIKIDDVIEFTITFLTKLKEQHDSNK